MADASPRRSLPHAALKCFKCGYSLAGLSELVCPECGTLYDSARAARRDCRFRWMVSVLVMALAIYAPFSWLILIDYPWNDYRWQWVIRWPALPMLMPAALLRRWFSFEIDNVWAIILMTFFSLLAIFGLAWLGAQRWRTLI